MTPRLFRARACRHLRPASCVMSHQQCVSPNAPLITRPSHGRSTQHALQPPIHQDRPGTIALLPLCPLRLFFPSPARTGRGEGWAEPGRALMSPRWPCADLRTAVGVQIAVLRHHRRWPQTGACQCRSRHTPCCLRSTRTKHPQDNSMSDFYRRAQAVRCGRWTVLNWRRNRPNLAVVRLVTCVVFSLC
jgi:hypothetical protein